MTAAILYGRETGLPPMTSLSQIHVVEGRPAMSAEGMRAMVLAAGHDIEVTETTGATCTMRGRRRGSETWTTVTWTIDMARAAGLTGKNNWKSYPRQMLQARATAELARLCFPDVIHGFRAVEEFDETDGPSSAASPEPKATARVRRGRAVSPPQPATPQPAEAEGVDLPPLPGEDTPQTDVGGEEPGDGLASVPPTSPNSDAPDGEAAVVVEVVEDREPPGSGPASKAQTRMLFAMLKGLAVTTDAARHDIATRILGHPVTSYGDLTSGAVSNLIDTLSMCRTADDLARLLESIEQAELIPTDQ